MQTKKVYGDPVADGLGARRAPPLNDEQMRRLKNPAERFSLYPCGASHAMNSSARAEFMVEMSVLAIAFEEFMRAISNFRREPSAETIPFSR
ncbi:MAG TPA: hypothetical protein VND66_00565 [Acidobacteriaceae bacterium]|nr:hypothetical protein [Terriglobia bacterium]HVC89086.1 hypothetical protein [Acidobacteriaceae bacterium]